MNTLYTLGSQYELQCKKQSWIIRSLQLQWQTGNKLIECAKCTKHIQNKEKKLCFFFFSWVESYVELALGQPGSIMHECAAGPKARNKAHASRSDNVCVLGEAPQKSKFRIDSEDLTCSLIPVHKGFNRRKLHTQAKQLLAPSGGRLGVYPPLPGQGLFFIGGS